MFKSSTLVKTPSVGVSVTAEKTVLNQHVCYTIHIVCKKEAIMPQEVKERHNIMIPSDLWNLVKELGRIHGKSASEIIEDSVKSHIKNSGFSRAFFRLMAAPECSPEENEALAKALDSLITEETQPGGTVEL